MTNYLKAHSIQNCRNKDCSNKTILSEDYYGPLNEFKCPICQNKSILFAEQKLRIGQFTQCKDCNVYFTIDKSHLESQIPICYICSKQKKSTIFLTEEDMKINPVSYRDMVSGKYKVIKEHPTVEQWIKHLSTNENNIKTYYGCKINWDIWIRAFKSFAINNGYWSIIPDLPIERIKFINYEILEKAMMLYYSYCIEKSKNIFKDNIEALCIEYIFIAKTKDCYVYFNFSTYIPEDDSYSEIGKVEGGIGKIIYDNNWKDFVNMIKKEN